MEQTSRRFKELSQGYLAGHRVGAPVELSQVMTLVPRLSASALHARTAVLRLADEETGSHDETYRFDLAGPEVASAAEESRRRLVGAFVGCVHPYPILRALRPADAQSIG